MSDSVSIPYHVTRSIVEKRFRPSLLTQNSVPLVFPAHLVCVQIGIKVSFVGGLVTRCVIVILSGEQSRRKWFFLPVIHLARRAALFVVPARVQGHRLCERARLNFVFTLPSERLGFRVHRPSGRRGCGPLAVPHCPPCAKNGRPPPSDGSSSAPAETLRPR